jgi:glycolate oxidase subunit GlcD
VTSSARQLAGSGGIASPALARDLGAIVGAEHVIAPAAPPYLTDATESRGIAGEGVAVVLPGSAGETAAVAAWCFERGVPMVPRGGGTGFAAGAVPAAGQVVVSTERLTAVRAFDPLSWRMHAEAGLRTRDVQRLARESGLFFPPDPGAAEQSRIGGNIATNAGGPHAFKYGVTGRWVTGLEAVVWPGEVLTFGGPARKDVAGLDLRSLLIGSEGTLGIITAAWLRLVPAPEAALPVAATFEGHDAGCDAIEAILGSGLQPAALEYLDGGALDASAAAFPVEVGEPGFMVIAEADGGREEAERLRGELLEALRDAGAGPVHAPVARAEIDALWRWRDGVSLAVAGRLGHKLSEDVAVPVDRLRDVIAATVELGARHGAPGCSWGHAGDGNVHASFLFAPSDDAARHAAEAAASELVALAVELGGTVSGEHGIGTTKLEFLHAHTPERALELQRRVKAAFDPGGLLNPGKGI